jgi:hypothetical protein
VDILCGRAAGVQVWVVPTGATAAEGLARFQPARVLCSLHQSIELLLPG